MLSQLWTMTAGDLRQRVRDRSVLIFGLGDYPDWEKGESDSRATSP